MMLIVFTSLMGAAQQLLEDKPIKLLSAKISLVHLCIVSTDAPLYGFSV